AHSRGGANVILITKRKGQTKYFGIIIVPSDSPAKKVADLKGKRFAFVDPLSTSGSLYAKMLLAESGLDPEKDLQGIYAGGHDKVAIAVYRGQVDAGAIYADQVSDARDRLTELYPDIKKKTRVLARTATIPNDTVSVRA